MQIYLFFKSSNFRGSFAFSCRNSEATMSICPCICQTGPLHSDVINRVVCPVTCSSRCKRPSLDCQTRDIPAPQNINPDNNNSNISSIITLKHDRNANIFTVIHKHMHLFSKKQNLFIKTFIKCLLS